MDFDIKNRRAITINKIAFVYKRVTYFGITRKFLNLNFYKT